ncbi:MAG: phosphatidylglycerophosphatase A, partial [Gammaproteobacteria bacterium]
GFGSGLSPKMPGTMGTVIAVGLYLLLPEMDWKIYLGIILVSFIVGIFLCDYTAKALNVHDHPGIVWDEIVGYFITMFMVPKSWLWILIGFVLFRLFDICKPWPISVADKRLKGGLGIILDDVIAGLFALIIIQIILYLL